MPKNTRYPANIPPARLIPGTKDPILSTGPPKDAEDWKIKNARAKELIMSTLVPGSEPWKIAEPLELASDIWKALEARYAPSGTQPSGDKAVKEIPKDSAEVVDAGPKSLESISSADSDMRRQEEAMSRATKEFHESMPNRDQRFLWALLHGGKDETNEWFYGASIEA